MYRLTKTVLAALMITTVAGCGVLKEAKKSDTESCKDPLLYPQGQAGGGRDVYKTGSDDGADTTATPAPLPINNDALRFALSDVGVNPDHPVPANPQADPVPITVPYPQDECFVPHPNNQIGNDPIGIDPAGPYPIDRGSDAKQCPVTTIKKAGIAPQAGAGQPTEDRAGYNQGVQQFSACPSDGTTTKNMPPTGHSATLNIDWQIPQGVANYETGKQDCVALGEGWHMANQDE